MVCTEEHLIKKATLRQGMRANSMEVLTNIQWVIKLDTAELLLGNKKNRWKIKEQIMSDKQNID